MKTIIITGASGNLGQAVVKKFLLEGYRVIGSFLPGEVTNVSFDHENFTKLEIDLANEKAAHQCVTDAIAKHGTIDVLVATVGGFAMGKIIDTSVADIRKQYELNFETAYNIARPLFNHMMESRNGRIFLVGSRPGLNAGNSKGMIAYGLSKSLIFRLAELMNDEAKGTNVVTSVLVPSTIDTAANRASMKDADFSSWVKAEAIADTIHFYCTEQAAAVREPVIKLYNNA